MLLFLESIGTMEVVVILLFVLMFFGSKSIPDISRTLGKTMREMRDATQGLKDEINKSTSQIRNEIEKNKTEFNNKLNVSNEVEDIKKSFNESSLKRDLNEIKTELNNTSGAIQKDLSPPEDSIKA